MVLLSMLLIYPFFFILGRGGGGGGVWRPKEIKSTLVPVLVSLLLFPLVNIILSQACGANCKLQLIDSAEHPGTHAVTEVCRFESHPT